MYLRCCVCLPGAAGEELGEAKYQISGDENCQNPFAGNLAILP